LAILASQGYLAFDSIHTYSRRQVAAADFGTSAEYPVLGCIVKIRLMIPMERSIFSADQRKLTDLLRQVRLGAGLRQDDLAKRLERPQSFVSKYESGERGLDLLELREICDALGISLQSFVERLEKSLQ
jgi:DNA-binding XRE family transcriptional regulator